MRENSRTQTPSTGDAQKYKYKYNQIQNPEETMSKNQNKLYQKKMKIYFEICF